MNQENLFEQDWRDCLRAHYVHVIHERDVVNEESLITVLRQTGFTDDDISAIRAETVASLGWDTQDVSSDDSKSDIIDAAPSNVAPETLSEALPTPPEPSQRADQPASAEAVKPAGQIKPVEEDEPPEPESFTQMSLF